MPLVKVDTPGSSILRGLAIPFGEYAFMVTKDGDLFAEVFDEESIPRLPQNVPLLVSHDRDRPPAGKVTSSVIMRQGLGSKPSWLATTMSWKGGVVVSMPG